MLFESCLPIHIKDKTSGFNELFLSSFVTEPNVYNLRTKLMALHLLAVILPNYKPDDNSATRKVSSVI